MPRYFFAYECPGEALPRRAGFTDGGTDSRRILSDYFIARLTLTEVPSVFAKKVRIGEIPDADFDLLSLRFYADVLNRTVTPVRILNAHFESAGYLIAKHGKTRQIHTLDAIQLAVALSIRQPAPIDRFVCRRPQAL